MSRNHTEYERPLANTSILSYDKYNIMNSRLANNITITHLGGGTAYNLILIYCIGAIITQYCTHAAVQLWAIIVLERMRVEKFGGPNTSNSRNYGVAAPCNRR